jgi:hypothetical protein
MSPFSFPEVYRNKRDWEKRNRDRAVDPRGRTIKEYKEWK